MSLWEGVPGVVDGVVRHVAYHNQRADSDDRDEGQYECVFDQASAGRISPEALEDRSDECAQMKGHNGSLSKREVNKMVDRRCGETGWTQYRQHEMFRRQISCSGGRGRREGDPRARPTVCSIASDECRDGVGHRCLWARR